MKKISVSFKKPKIEKIKIFCREEGDSQKPLLLLLHGFPTSSHIFRGLIRTHPSWILGYGGRESLVWNGSEILVKLALTGRNSIAAWIRFNKLT